MTIRTVLFLSPAFPPNAYRFCTVLKARGARVPVLENYGVNTGPITGASIDYLNDPTDTAVGGWAKRMGMHGGELVGAVPFAGPMSSPLSTHPAE